MAVTSNTTTTATGAVVIKTVLTDGTSEVGAAETTFSSDDTTGSETLGHRTMRTSVWFNVPAEGNPFTNLKAVASGLASHYTAVGTFLTSITSE